MTAGAKAMLEAARHPAVRTGETCPLLNRPYRWHVVAMLWAISFFNYADRQALFSVFPLLEKQMGLTTIQLGLLGSSFAWVYGLCAMFAGLIVDRVRRKSAILGGLQAWSIICLCTGFVNSFRGLFVCAPPRGLARRSTIRLPCRS